MSKESYMAGFCKKAAVHNIDPKALARFAVQKSAESSSEGRSAGAVAKPGIWQNVIAAIEKAKASGKSAVGKAVEWHKNLSAPMKTLVNAGIGSAVGTGLGAAVAGKKGLRAGSILGAVGGAGSTVDWKALAEHLGKLSAQGKDEAGAATNA